MPCSLFRPLSLCLGAALSLLLVGCPGSKPAATTSTPSTTLIREAGNQPYGVRFFSRADFEAHPPSGADDWTMDGTELVTSGKTKGYIYSKKTFGPEDFVIHVEFQYVKAEHTAGKPPNTGLLLFIQEPHAVWPLCIEVQGRQDELATMKFNGTKDELDWQQDEELRVGAIKPIGDWNVLEVSSAEGRVTVTLNGEVVAESEPTELKSGPIGLQSEGNTVRFRNVWYRE